MWARVQSDKINTMAAQGLARGERGWDVALQSLAITGHLRTLEKSSEGQMNYFAETSSDPAAFRQAVNQNRMAGMSWENALAVTNARGVGGGGGSSGGDKYGPGGGGGGGNGGGGGVGPNGGPSKRPYKR